MVGSSGEHGLTPYVVKSLPEGEHLLVLAPYPTIVRAASWGTLAVVGVLPVVWLFWDALFGDLSSAMAILLLGLSVSGILVFLVSQVHMQTTEFGLTTRRVLYKRGIFTRFSNEIPLRSIENTQLRQGLIGRIFNFGRLEITGSGGSPVETTLVQNPTKLRAEIAEAKAELLYDQQPIDQAHNNDQEL